MTLVVANELNPHRVSLSLYEQNSLANRRVCNSLGQSRQQEFDTGIRHLMGKAWVDRAPLW